MVIQNRIKRERAADYLYTQGCAVRVGAVRARRQFRGALQSKRAAGRFGVDVCIDAGVSRMTRHVILVVGLMCTICTGAWAQNAPVAVTPEQVRQGSEIYAVNCATCHGNRMKNPEWAINLATIPKDDRQRFIQSVTSGKGNMPPWGDVLKANEIEALWAYFSQGEK